VAARGSVPDPRPFLTARVAESGRRGSPFTAPNIRFADPNGPFITLGVGYDPTIADAPGGLNESAAAVELVVATAGCVVPTWDMFCGQRRGVMDAESSQLAPTFIPLINPASDPAPSASWFVPHAAATRSACVTQPKNPVA
jgi:hypothetical protein